VIERAGACFGLNLISALNGQGQFCFRIQEATVNPEYIPPSSTSLSMTWVAGSFWCSIKTARTALRLVTEKALEFSGRIEIFVLTP
jgi:hypothetical protein